jgi:hypothetical protein
MAYHFQKMANKPGRPSLAASASDSNEEFRRLIYEKRISMANNAASKPDSGHYPVTSVK